LVLRWPAIVELAPVEMATVSSNGHHAADSDDEFALPLS